MTRKWNWYGEGDDMIFIDGEEWPPSIHGTGTEDYFNTSWCPTQEQDTPYHGIILGGGPNWSGKSTYYRYHIQDAIVFNESIKVTIEHEIVADHHLSYPIPYNQYKNKILYHLMIGFLSLSLHHH